MSTHLLPFDQLLFHFFPAILLQDLVDKTKSKNSTFNAFQFEFLENEFLENEFSDKSSELMDDRHSEIISDSENLQNNLQKNLQKENFIKILIQQFLKHSFRKGIEIFLNCLEIKTLQKILNLFLEYLENKNLQQKRYNLQLELKNLFLKFNLDFILNKCDVDILNLMCESLEFYEEINDCCKDKKNLIENALKEEILINGTRELLQNYFVNFKFEYLFIIFKNLCKKFNCEKICDNICKNNDYNDCNENDENCDKNCNENCDNNDCKNVTFYVLFENLFFYFRKDIFNENNSLQKNLQNNFNYKIILKNLFIKNLEFKNEKSNFCKLFITFLLSYCFPHLEEEFKEMFTINNLLINLNLNFKKFLINNLQNTNLKNINLKNINLIFLNKNEFINEINSLQQSFTINNQSMSTLIKPEIKNEKIITTTMTTKNNLKKPSTSTSNITSVSDTTTTTNNHHHFKTKQEIVKQKKINKLKNQENKKEELDEEELNEEKENKEKTEQKQQEEEEEENKEEDEEENETILKEEEEKKKKKKNLPPPPLPNQENRPKIKIGVLPMEIYQHYTAKEIQDICKHFGLIIKGNSMERSKRIVKFLNGDVKSTISGGNKRKKKTTSNSSTTKRKK